MFVAKVPQTGPEIFHYIADAMLVAGTRFSEITDVSFSSI
jgi:hypothetical protein